MQTVTLKGNDFTQVHNALCELRSIRGLLEPVVREPLLDKLSAAIRSMEAGLEDAYAQDSEAFDRKHEHYLSIKEFLSLKAIWSIYEVDNLRSPHPFTEAREVCYGDHWGGEAVVEPIPGKTWTDLYVAASRCIEKSGDSHHIFIEAFTPVAEKPHQLRLTTGS